MAMEELNLKQLSSGQPTHWPTDPNKVPDLIDFCVTKGFAENNLQAQTSLYLSSDHTPININVSTSVINTKLDQKLHNKKTNWEKYRKLINEKTTLNVPLQTCKDIDVAVKNFNNIISEADYILFKI